MPFRNKTIIFQNNFLQRLVKARAFLKKNALKYVLFLGLLGEFHDSRIQASRFESRILESTIIRFESHESNGKLIYKGTSTYGLFMMRAP